MSFFFLYRIQCFSSKKKCFQVFFFLFWLYTYFIRTFQHMRVKCLFVHSLIPLINNVYWEPTRNREWAVGKNPGLNFSCFLYILKEVNFPQVLHCCILQISTCSLLFVIHSLLMIICLLI